MPYTNFPDGITSMGVPYPGAGGGVVPFTGNYYFCDYANGSDGNTGGAQDPLKTIERAYNLATAGNNDVIVIIGDGSTTATQRLSSTLTWAKDATHLLGMTAPVMESQRARIAPLTTATTNFKMMSVTASGCMFANFSFFQGVGQSATDEQLIDISGDRNYFGNVQFGGMGAAAGAARAGSYIIAFSGAEENLFEHCSIGLETIQRSAANASVKFRDGSKRNIFRDCQFPMAASATSPLWVDANQSNAFNGGSNTFWRCSFRNLLNISSANTPAVTAVVASDVNGTLFFDQSTTMAAKWAAAAATVKVASTPVSNGFNGGVFASAADS
jgi:hypothetical protein